MVSFTAFDVENDEYLIGMDENGVLHQYTISACKNAPHNIYLFLQCKIIKIQILTAIIF